MVSSLLALCLLSWLVVYTVRTLRAPALSTSGAVRPSLLRRGIDTARKASAVAFLALAIPAAVTTKDLVLRSNAPLAFLTNPGRAVAEFAYVAGNPMHASIRRLAEGCERLGGERASCRGDSLVYYLEKLLPLKVCGTGGGNPSCIPPFVQERPDCTKPKIRSFVRSVHLVDGTIRGILLVFLTFAIFETVKLLRPRSGRTS
jgi:hypothetical protein